MAEGPAARFWPEGWWRLVDVKIGIIPLPVYILVAILLAVLVQEGEVKPDGPTMIAVLVMGGFTCAEIGKRIPILRNIGSAAIFATFIPSALAYYKLIPPQIEKSRLVNTLITSFLRDRLKAVPPQLAPARFLEKAARPKRPRDGVTWG